MYPFIRCYVATYMNCGHNYYYQLNKNLKNKIGIIIGDNILRVIGKFLGTSGKNNR